MTLLRRYRQWSLLPAIVWLGMQLAMSMGQAVAAPAGGAKAPPELAPLVAGLKVSDWLCEAADERHHGPGDPIHALAAECYWCQGFGAMPQAYPPDPLPPCIAPSLSNQPFADQAPPVAVSRLTGFRSRAPPL